MINIVIDHDWCYCSWDKGTEELQALREACSYKVEDRWFNTAYTKGHWDGKKYLFKKIRSKDQGGFPTGIFQAIICKLQIASGLQIDVKDLRVYPHHSECVDTSRLKFKLRDYQTEAVNACLKYKRGVLRLPTAAGKTKAMIGLIATLDLPTLWITHEGALARQSLEQIKDGVNSSQGVGFYAGGKDKNIKRWTVALVQSLHRNRKRLQWWFDQIKVVVLDECHRGGARSWSEAAMSIPAPFRFGCSATPFERSDNSTLELMGVTGGVIYECEVEDIKQHLSRPYVEMIQTPREPIIASAWLDVYRKGIIDNGWRNDVVIERAMRSVKEKSACIVFVSRVEHGEILSDMLSREIGVNSLHSFISGRTDQFSRDECYSKLQSGGLYVLVATDKVTGEGQDIPAVSRIVVAGGLKGSIVVKQRIGRGMRPSGNGKGGWGGEVKIHDFVDRCHPRLFAHSDLRREHYKNVDAVIKETQYHELSSF